MIKSLNAALFSTIILLTAVFVQAAELRPLGENTAVPEKNMAVLYFDSSKRFDLNILAEYISDCAAYKNVSCVCAESSDASDKDVKAAFEGIGDTPCIFRGKTEGALPRIEFVKEGRLAGTIEKNGSFASKTNIYLEYLSGAFSREDLAEKLKAADGAENYKRIVPRMNFVLMLAKKGQTDSALKELDKISADELDNKGKLLLGQTYLRLKSPEKAVDVFETCGSADCTFYRGVAEYVSGETDEALRTLKGLKGTFKDENKLNYYLKKIYEAEGDMKNAEEIRLPENYNIDSE